MRGLRQRQSPKDAFRPLDPLRCPEGQVARDRGHGLLRHVARPRRLRGTGVLLRKGLIAHRDTGDAVFQATGKMLLLRPQRAKREGSEMVRREVGR